MADAVGALGRRGRLTAFVGQHALAWELTMGALTVVYAALAFMDDQAIQGAPQAVVVTLSAVFLLEFAGRCADAPSRLGYLRGHWLDLVTCIPAAGPLRALRLVRLLGLLRLMGHVRRLALEHATMLSGAWVVGPTVLVIWLAAAEGFWVLEHGRNAAVQTFGDALYLAFMTVTTVGYGDVRPVTAEGKVLAGTLVFVGLGLLGFLSSRLTLAWTRIETEEELVRQELIALRAEVARLADLLEERRAP